MKLPIRSTALALALTLTAIGCTDPQTASPSTPAAADPVAEAPAVEAPMVDAPVDASTLSVVNWGPKTTVAGSPFNVQPDGSSGVFFELSGAVPLTEIQATIGGKPLSGLVASGNVVTGIIPMEYLETPGTYPVELVVPEQNARIQAGDFIVE